MGGWLFLWPTMIAFAAVVSVVGLTAADSYRRFEERLGLLQRDRLMIVLHDIELRLEEEVSLGLSLASLGDVSERLRRWASDSPEIRLIEVFAPGGTVLFSTDATYVGDSVPDAWLTAWEERVGDWMVSADGLETIGVTLTDTAGRALGGLGITYEVNARQALRPDTVDDLVLTGGAILGGALILLLAGFLIILRPTDRYFRGLNRATRALAVETGTDGAAGSGTGVAWSDRFLATAAAASMAIGEAGQTIRALDRRDDLS